MVEFLLTQGAPVAYGQDKYRASQPDDTGLHWACMGWRQDDRTEAQQTADRLAVIDLLAAKLGNVDAPAHGLQDGMTPLTIAAQSGKIPVVRHLLTTSPQIDVNAKSDLGNTALLLAVPPLLRNPGDRPASREGWPDRAAIIRLLRARGARSDIRNRQDETASGRARQLGDERILAAFGPLPPEQPDGVGRPTF